MGATDDAVPVSQNLLTHCWDLLQELLADNVDDRWVKIDKADAIVD